MRTLSVLFALSVGAAFAAPDTLAQEAERQVCDYVDPVRKIEIPADAPGHAIVVARFSCRIRGGPMAGGVSTGWSIFEVVDMTATLLAGSGVARKSDGVAAFQQSEGKVQLKLGDGKLAGAKSLIYGRYVYASGSAAPLAGAAFVTSSDFFGPGEFGSVSNPN